MMQDKQGPLVGRNRSISARPCPGSLPERGEGATEGVNVGKTVTTAHVETAPCRPRRALACFSGMRADLGISEA